MPARKRAASPYARLRLVALSFPDTREEFPWGECAVKVRGKIFLFVRESAEGLGLSVKLPQSREFALEYPFTEPTGYGLGKAGWVSSRFKPKERPPMDVLEAWIGESYRAVVPKKLVDALASKARRKAG
jgi:predicted DNA-binding protein (MmcQ/YjbR family)